jgi:sigma-B regulation protein RsbU (phosphoserine phosphatase)
MRKPSRILVVDDEPGMVRAVERVLADAHQVRGTRSSLQAVDIAAELDPDLAILDVRMPGLDGFELMERLKAAHPQLDVILMTGSVDELDAKLVRAIRGRAFYFLQKPFDREVLLTLVERCLELRWHRVANERHLTRLETELGEARAFQQGLLPAADAVVGPLALGCRYRPCSAMGGDLYDYAAVAPGRAALIMADVSGHGVSAAMLTGVVKSAFHASHADGFDPLAVVQRVSTSLAAFGAERFVTLFAALVDRGGQSAHYVNAGHPPGLLWRGAGPALRLSSTGPLVSPALAGCVWEREVVAIGAGDRLFLYTDGLLEPFIDERDGGDRAFVAQLDGRARDGTLSADRVVEDVAARLASGPQPDDVTLVLATVLP